MLLFDLLLSFNLLHESESLAVECLSFDSELDVVIDFEVQLGFVVPLFEAS